MKKVLFNFAILMAMGTVSVQAESDCEHRCRVSYVDCINSEMVYGVRGCKNAKRMCMASCR